MRVMTWFCKSPLIYLVITQKLLILKEDRSDQVSPKVCMSIMCKNVYTLSVPLSLL